MSRLSKWRAELKRNQDVHNAHCAGIYVFDDITAHLRDHPCEPDCDKCVLQKTTFDNWFEETFK